MCDFTNGLKFCTCDPAKGNIRHNKKSRRNKDASGAFPKEFTWILDRYVTTLDTGEMGRMLMPHGNIGNGLTEEWVLLHLNLENCFDFDYTPEEGDSLKIRDNDDPYLYLSFIFKGNSWIAGVNTSFDAVYEEKNRGFVQPVVPDEPQD
jgi:hypothetical protein